MQKYKSYIIVALAVVLVVVGFLIYKKQAQAPTINNNKNTPNQSTDAKPGQSGNYLEGTLRISNDNTRGNLMVELMNSDRIIYLRTSRDFSGLINQNVSVQIEGTIDRFSLIDIQPQVPKVKEIKIN